MSIDLSSTAAKASYGIGLQMGQQLKTVFKEVSLQAALAGVEDAFRGRTEQLSPDEINQAFAAIQKQIESEKVEQSKQLAGEGAAFLADNAKREGVVVTASGLQYEIIEQGSGAVPTARSTVRTHYRGTLLNGTEFDSSYRRNDPTEFPVNGVIAGWTEALQLMPVGSKWKLFIPYNLAYGERGAGGDIGPYQALIFEIELLDIVR
ncbi:MAG: FKBP-type peptidyl-prolyl cis-trans isomerase [Spongiibacteraceae bacterium]